jgi:hypothetical protein
VGIRMTAFTNLVSSGGVQIGQTLTLTNPYYYPSVLSLGNMQLLHTGNLLAYNSNYSTLVSSYPAMGYYNHEANANVILLNANNSLNWANAVNSVAFSPVTSSPVYGHAAKLEKTNTDFLLITMISTLTLTSAAVQAVINAYANSANTIYYKYGPNIANLATGNSSYTIRGYNGTGLLANGTYGTGFNDSISYNGRVIVIGGVTACQQTPNSGSGVDYLSYSNGVILHSNTNTFSQINVALFNGSNANVDYALPDYGTQYTTTTPSFFVFTGIASNGNHIVVHTKRIAQSNAYIMTSTDGVSWTGRTMSGAPANVEIYRTAYSNSGNCYIFVSSSGNVYTSTDGYTLTTRTSPIVPNSLSIYPVIGQSCMSATSNSNTFIILSANTMYRTSNGVSFSRINMDLDANLKIFAASAATRDYMSIAYVNGKFIISGSNGRTVYSDDDGATWKLDYGRYPLNLTNTEPGYSTYLGQTVHNNSLYCVLKSATNVVPINLTTSTAQTTPHLFGMQEVYTGSWLRIK